MNLILCHMFLRISLEEYNSFLLKVNLIFYKNNIDDALEINCTD